MAMTRKLHVRRAWPCLAVLGRACLAIGIGQRQGAVRTPSAVLAPRSDPQGSSPPQPSPGCPPPRPGAVPKVIWYTHKSQSHVSQQFERNLRDRNPGFALRFYDDAMIQRFLQESYGPEHVRAFQSLQNGAHKADFWRYAILFKEGGYYVDTDNGVLVPLEDITESNEFTSVISATGLHGVHVHNGFIATIPGNPIMEHLLSHMVQHASAEPGYPLYGYHYYVRYFFEVLNASLPPAGLAPLTEYNFMGMRTTFLYHEFPNPNVYDRNGVSKLLVGHHGFEGRTPVPKYINLTTKEWHPTKFHEIGHKRMSPLAHLSRCGPAVVAAASGGDVTTKKLRRLMAKESAKWVKKLTK